jgi:hypothetical protein
MMLENTNIIVIPSVNERINELLYKPSQINKRIRAKIINELQVNRSESQIAAYDYINRTKNIFDDGEDKVVKKQFFNRVLGITFIIYLIYVLIKF